MWVSGWVDQKLVRRPGWTRGGLANTDSLYRKDYTQTVGKVQSGIKWNYWHERRRCSPSQLGNDWQWRIYSSLQYGHCGQSWLSSTTLRLNSVFMLDICWYERRHCSLLPSDDDWQWSNGDNRAGILAGVKALQLVSVRWWLVLKYWHKRRHWLIDFITSKLCIIFV